MPRGVLAEKPEALSPDGIVALALRCDCEAAHGAAAATHVRGRRAHDASTVKHRAQGSGEVAQAVKGHSRQRAGVSRVGRWIRGGNDPPARSTCRGKGEGLSGDRHGRLRAHPSETTSENAAAGPGAELTWTRTVQRRCCPAPLPSTSSPDEGVGLTLARAEGTSTAFGPRNAGRACSGSQGAAALHPAWGIMRLLDEAKTPAERGAGGWWWPLQHRGKARGPACCSSVTPGARWRHSRTAEPRGWWSRPRSVVIRGGGLSRR